MIKKKEFYLTPLVIIGVFFMFSVVFKINAQNYNIRFAATGASNTIDSVKVDNITKGITLTLPGNDTLHLGVVGINDINVNDENLKIYPNPMHGQSELTFYAKQSVSTQLTIYDISGKKVIQNNVKILQGLQRFRIAGLRQGMYFINICSENYFNTVKLICQNTSQSTPSIEYIGSDLTEVVIQTLKSLKKVNMAYTNGDLLLFKGISGNYSTIITDLPIASKIITFNFVACTDADNNSYSVVQIGTQLWMAENLKTARYRNGNPIPYIADDMQWSCLRTGAYCCYNNNQGNSKIFGNLYNWYAVNDSSNIAPQGWHVPSDAEWTKLANYLGGESIAGSKLKETTFWASPNSGATNETGFNALPGGFRYYYGTFNNIGYSGSWWSSTDNLVSTACSYYWSLSYESEIIYSLLYYNEFGFSVRCVKD